MQNLKYDKTLALNTTLLYFSAVEWTGICQRPHQLSRVMVQSLDKVVFVQPSGLRNLRFTDLPRVYYWFVNKVKKLFKKIKQVKKVSFQDLRICSPIFLPFNGIKILDRINSLMAYQALRPYLKESRGQNLIFWISAPFPYLPYLLSKIDTRVYLIYDLIDDYRLFRKPGSGIFEVESKLISLADLVFVSSSKLKEKVLKVKDPKQVFLLPNGVDLEHWNKSTKANEKSLFKGSNPIIGYFGNIAAWLDSETISCLAQKRPDWQFVFIGPIYKTSHLEPLFEIPNIHFLGPKKYEHLPHWAKDFDVCWIPFKIDSITKSINPLKAYEYLALGKQVIAPRLPDLTDLEPYVLCVGGLSEYESALEICLGRSTDNEIKAGCRQTAARYSWSGLWDEAFYRISSLILDTQKEIV